jgi:hypothetical protein
MYNLISIIRDDHKENGFPTFVRNAHSHIRSDMDSSDCVVAGFCQLQGNLVRLQGQLRLDATFHSHKKSSMFLEVPSWF